MMTSWWNHSISSTTGLSPEPLHCHCYWWGPREECVHGYFDWSTFQDSAT